MTSLDRILVSIDRNPLGGLVRILLGFFFIPALSLLRLDVNSGWTLAIGFLSALVLLRIGPAFMRKVLPMSPEVKAVWSERRRIAKRYDSFQWQKLFFIGIGLVCYALVSHGSRSSIALSVFCVACGGIGVVRWYTQASKVRDGLVNQHVL